MSNFSFITSPWEKLTHTAKEAEKQVYGAPDHAAMLCRRSLEEWVRWMYELVICDRAICDWVNELRGK